MSSIELSLQITNDRTSCCSAEVEAASESMGAACCCCCSFSADVSSSGRLLPSSSIFRSVMWGYTEWRRRSLDCWPSQRSEPLHCCERMYSRNVLRSFVSAVLKIDLRRATRCDKAILDELRQSYCWRVETEEKNLNIASRSSFSISASICATYLRLQTACTRRSLRIGARSLHFTSVQYTSVYIALHWTLNTQMWLPFGSRQMRNFEYRAAAAASNWFSRFWPLRLNYMRQNEHLLHSSSIELPARVKANEFIWVELTQLIILYCPVLYRYCPLWGTHAPFGISAQIQFWAQLWTSHMCVVPRRVLSSETKRIKCSRTTRVPACRKFNNERTTSALVEVQCNAASDRIGNTTGALPSAAFILTLTIYL